MGRELIDACRYAAGAHLRVKLTARPRPRPTLARSAAVKQVEAAGGSVSRRRQIRGHGQADGDEDEDEEGAGVKGPKAGRKDVPCMIAFHGVELSAPDLTLRMGEMAHLRTVVEKALVRARKEERREAVGEEQAEREEAEAKRRAEAGAAAPAGPGAGAAASDAPAAPAAAEGAEDADEEGKSITQAQLRVRAGLCAPRAALCGAADARDSTSASTCPRACRPCAGPSSGRRGTTRCSCWASICTGSAAAISSVGSRTSPGRPRRTPAG